MRDSVDVVVVGGRIAGCLTALRLVAEGVSVRLLESHALPSETLSTHFFRGDGLVRSLREVGALDDVLATGAPPLECEYFSIDGAPFEQGGPQDPGTIGYCLSVRRKTLDVILVQHALAAGVDVRTRTRVVDIVKRDGVVVGVSDEHGATHRAQVIIGADGRRSIVARLVSASDEERHPPARAMYYRYAQGWQGMDPIGPEFLLQDRSFCYAFPSDAGIACLALSVPLDEHEQAGGDYAGTLDRAFRSNPRTAERMDAIEWESGVFAGLPMDSVWRTGCGAGWALVGDAGVVQDPWSGLGMDTAARHAEAFTEAYVGSDWRTRYPELRRLRTYDGYAQTTRLAPDLRQLASDDSNGRQPA